MKWMMTGLMCISAACLAMAEDAAPATAPAPAPAQAAAEPAAAPPKIVCDQPSFDFGAAEPGAVINHEYEVRNDGGTTLEIRNVRASCGCTIVKPPANNMLKPGETAKIGASLNLAGRNGHQEKHVIVESNDPATPTMLLNLRGDVRQEIAITPERLTPGQIRGDVSVEMDVLFGNNSPTPIHVMEARSSTTNLYLELSTITTGKEYRVHVKTMPPLPPGVMAGTISLFTDYPSRPVFEVPFNAVIQGPLAVIPTAINVQQSLTGPMSQTIVIRPVTAPQVKVVSVETPDPAITTEQSPFGSNGVRLQVNNIVAKPELNGKSIKITTDVEGMREIFIPFNLIPAPGAAPHS